MTGAENLNNIPGGAPVFHKAISATGTKRDELLKSNDPDTPSKCHPAMRSFLVGGAKNLQGSTSEPFTPVKNHPASSTLTAPISQFTSPQPDPETVPKFTPPPLVVDDLEEDNLFDVFVSESRPVCRRGQVSAFTNLAITYFQIRIDYRQRWVVRPRVYLGSRFRCQIQLLSMVN